ncbi:PspC domain-containing protein [Rubrivirga marina]|uniref:PspC domain-containing protein n=1 Tax=Rubrivirga marina TaxID=1196024 RepID=UPI001FE8BD71|nr:PspC domain-containing protein [Rubrivirga marina]
MSTRSRSRGRTSETEAYDDEFGLVTDDDIVAFMAEQEIEEEELEEKEAGFWNLQTASGIGLIGLGALYSLQLLGLFPLGSAVLYNLVQVLPIFAAILIMLTGFGVLSWSPAARRRKKARKRAARRRQQQRRAARKTVGRTPRSETSTGDAAGKAASKAFRQAEKALRTAGRAAGRVTDEAFERRATARRAGRTRLAKDRKNRKITGVAAGMANYFGLDPTVVRIGWVVAAIFTNFAAVIPYLILTAVLKNEEDLEDDDDPILRITDD